MSCWLAAASARLVLVGGQAGATKAYLHSVLLFLKAMDPDGLENVERPLAILGSDLESLERGSRSIRLKPAERGAGPKPLSDEEWMRRAVQALALSFWMARHKGRRPWCDGDSHHCLRPHPGQRQGCRNHRLAQNFGCWRAPAKAVADYRELCGMLGALPPDLSSEERFPELVRLLLEDDLTRSKDFRRLCWKARPANGGKMNFW